MSTSKTHAFVRQYGQSPIKINQGQLDLVQLSDPLILLARLALSDALGIYLIYRNSGLRRNLRAEICIETMRKQPYKRPPPCTVGARPPSVAFAS